MDNMPPDYFDLFYRDAHGWEGGIGEARKIYGKQSVAEGVRSEGVEVVAPWKPASTDGLIDFSDFVFLPRFANTKGEEGASRFFCYLFGRIISAWIMVNALYSNIYLYKIQGNSCIKALYSVICI